MAHEYSSLHYTKIAFIPLHTNLFNIVLLSFFLSLGYSNLYSQDIKKKQTSIQPNKQEVKKPGIRKLYFRTPSFPVTGFIPIPACREAGLPGHFHVLL